MGSAVPCRVRLLLLHSQAESEAYYGIPLDFHDILLFFYVTIQERVSPEFIGSRTTLTIVCYYGKYSPVLEFHLRRSQLLHDGMGDRVHLDHRDFSV